MRLTEDQRSTEWVAQPPAVVSALNNEVTRLTGKKPSVAVKAKKVAERPFSVVAGRPVGLKVQRLPSSVDVRYLYQPGELEEVIAGQPTLRCLYSKPLLYYLLDGPPQGFDCCRHAH